MPTLPIISVKRLNHYFGQGRLRKQTLFDISADIFPGEVVLLTGPSGSGKTTLLTLIGALRAVNEGSVRTLDCELRNADLTTMVQVRRSIGFIFQAHNLLDSLTARQNVQLSLGLEDGISPGEARKRCAEMLAAVGLGERIDYMPRQLSGGQKQRVAIARALVRKPKVILADEPTAALDKQTGREVVNLLQSLAKRQQCSILLVTHDNRILDIADRILTLEDGRLLSYASSLLATTGHLLTAFAQLQERGELQRQVEALTDEQFVGLLERASSEFSLFLQTLDQANRKATASLLDEILKALAIKIRILIGADRTTVYLVDEARGQLRSQFAQHDGADPLEITIPIERGIAGRVARTGETLNISDPYHHPDFFSAIDQQTGYRTTSILCAPIYDKEGQVFAVVQLLNKLNAPAFTTTDESRLREFARGLAVLLESCKQLTAAESSGQSSASPAEVARTTR
ncbi:MAG: ATP-binding cassette domain-containing protein [Terriglobales bacterium]